MEHSSGKKIKTCIFISGRGSNLRAIIKNSRKHVIPCEPLNDCRGFFSNNAILDFLDKHEETDPQGPPGEICPK